MTLQSMAGGSAATAAAVDISNVLSDIDLPLGEDVVDFRGYFNVQFFAPKAVIYRPGEPSNHVFLLKRGRVHLMRADRNSRRSLLAILKGGDLFGDVLVDGRVTEEFAIAAMPETEVWSIEAREFRSLLESRPSLALDIIRAQSEGVLHLRRRAIGMTFKEVPARLAETIVQLGDSIGVRCPHGGEIDLRGITQQDLADLVGASRSFVSTLINEMKRDGFLSNVGRTLCIRDQKALRKIAA